ncbi:hypothetical protein K439DRAFT_1357969, partial [Ramaria rubella]
WNADNMFVGTIQGDVPPPPPSYGTPDTQSLFYNMILGALLIDLQGSEYHKFSGNEQVGTNKDKLGMVVDTFSHSIVIHSNKEYLLVDLQGILMAAGELIMFNPQGHSEQQNLCRWDQGISAIEDFLFQHTSNEVCHTLELDIATIVNPESEPHESTSSSPSTQGLNVETPNTQSHTGPLRFGWFFKLGSHALANTIYIYRFPMILQHP